MVTWELKDFDGKQETYESDEFKFTGYSVKLFLKLTEAKPMFSFKFSGLPENTYLQAVPALLTCYETPGIQGSVALVYKDDGEQFTLPMDVTKEDLTSSKWLRNGSLNFKFICKAYGDARELSLEPAPYAGLENQGATCYMNAMLQSLFHIPAFRRLVYNMPTTGTEDEQTCIPLNLQRLFCRMQLTTETCRTTNLTNSFGWGSVETIMQHDIQEFSRVLIDNLETKMKGTDLESSISDLFRGKTRSFIRCKNVPFESSRVEDFYDLTMVVKDCPNLRASFEKFTEKEILEGDNQYQTEEYGKQDAEMGVEFLEFPSVLQIHLSRFIYDFNFDQMVKLYDRFEFPKEIDLSDFLAKDADRSKSNVFELYGVLIHYGNVQVGHYYAFLRTSTSTEWFRFNDEQVTKTTENKAIVDNFGGDAAVKTQCRYRTRTSKKKPYSAYMLVYVRKEEAPRIFQPIPDDAVPDHLKKFVNNEIEMEKLAAEEEQEDESMIKGTFATEDDLVQRTLLGKTGFGNKKGKKYSFEPTATNKNLYEFIAKEFGKEIGKIRLWKTGVTSNPTDIIPCNNEYITDLYSYFYRSFHVFVQDKKEDEPCYLRENEITVFVKFFFPEQKFPVQYVGAFQAKKTDEFAVLAESVAKVVDVDPKHLVLYVETIGGDAKVQELNTKIDDSYISTGNVLIFQVSPEYSDVPKFEFKEPLPVEKKVKAKKDMIEIEKKKPSVVYDDASLKRFTVKDLVPDYSIRTFPMYLASKYTTADLRVIPLNDTTKPLCIITIPTKTPFAEIKKCIAKACGLEYDPNVDSMLLFSGEYTDECIPRSSPMDETTQKTPYQYYHTEKDVVSNLFFSLFKGISEKEIRRMSYYTVQFSYDGLTVAKEDRILVPKSSTCDDIKNAFAEKNKEIDAGVPYRYRQIYSAFVTSDLIEPNAKLPYKEYPLLIEQIPEDQRNLEHGDVIAKVKVGELTSYGAETYNMSFFIKILHDEKYESVKAKIVEKVKLTEDQKKKLKFKFKKSFYEELNLNDDDLVAQHVLSDSYISVITGEKKSSYQKEASIKIFN
jgi:ubiquitin carboxyl-terminal hydrolase 7